jgi:hypothetical protein
MGSRIRRLQEIIHGHDVVGVIKHLADAVRRRLDPEWRRRMRGYAAKDRVDIDFDRRYGVNNLGRHPAGPTGHRPAGYRAR